MFVLGNRLYAHKAFVPGAVVPSPVPEAAVSPAADSVAVAYADADVELGCWKPAMPQATAAAVAPDPP